jgi:hypothetical protein
MWTVVPYEPYASFPYWVRCHRSEQDWHRAHSLDDGHTLGRWHDSEVRRLVPTLSAADRAHVEAHRDRAYGHLQWDGAQSLSLDALLDPKV